MGRSRIPHWLYSLLLTAYFAAFDGQVITVRDGGSAWGCFGSEA